MRKFFFLGEKIDRNCGIAFTKGDTPIAHDLVPLLRGKDSIPFILYLKRVINEGGHFSKLDDISGLKKPWMDFQPNNLAWPIMSERMKLVIEKFLLADSDVEWLSVQIIGGNEERRYYLPRFKRKLDVLNIEKTIFVEGSNHIIKPVFSAEKLSNNIHFFHKPGIFWEITSGLYVSTELRDEIIKEKLTGIEFENVTVM